MKRKINWKGFFSIIGLIYASAIIISCVDGKIVENLMVASVVTVLLIGLIYLKAPSCKRTVVVEKTKPASQKTKEPLQIGVKQYFFYIDKDGYIQPLKDLNNKQYILDHQNMELEAHDKAFDAILKAYPNVPVFDQVAFVYTHNE